MSDLHALGALAAAGRVKAGTVSAVALAEAALARIDALNGRVNAFTRITAERALAEAAAIDATRAAGVPLPPLAGVPYAVKNLFDIEGIATLAGSKINRDLPAARRDCTLVAQMQAAGAVLLGALNMDEYAFGFTTENTHYGPTCNPHDLSRIAGGSSGGSAAAVAAGMVSLALGTDTNGSIRVPSSLCGIFGLKPTYGRLSRRGSYPFTGSFDHVGPFARSAFDLAAAYDVLQCIDALDPAQSATMLEPVSSMLAGGIEDLRIALAGDYFEANAAPRALMARDTLAQALGATRRVTLPEAQRARAAAFVITAAEGSQLHLADLRSRPNDFEPLIRDRFIANALAPAAWYLQAQRFRRWFYTAVMRVFEHTDIILAAATPVAATPIGAETFDLHGQAVPARPSMGLLTQPLSFIGLPIVTVPVHRAGQMPIGVQVIARPWHEADALRVAAWLERQGVVQAPLAKL